MNLSYIKSHFVVKTHHMFYNVGRVVPLTTILALIYRFAATQTVLESPTV